MALVVYLIVNLLDGVPETYFFYAVLHRMLASFLAVADDTHPFVFIHRDVHVAVLGDELALEPTTRFVLLQKEYHIESWEVGLDVVGEVPVLGFYMKARLVHHAQVSPCLADDDFIAPRVGLQCSFDVAFYLRLPRRCNEGEHGDCKSP